VFLMVTFGFFGWILNVKEVLAIAEPSLTLTVIVASPTCPFFGSSVIVRLLLLPPNKILVLAIKAGFEEALARTRSAAADSLSAIVTDSGGSTVFTMATWF